MIEESYDALNLYEEWGWTKESYIKQCHYCSFVWISTSHKTNCPYCNSNNYFVVPFKNHKGLSFEWLEKNGFPHIRSLLL